MDSTHLRAALLAGAIATMAAIAPAAAHAASAVAIGDAGDAAKYGLAVGLAKGYGSRGEAESVALDQCHSYQDAPQGTRDLCRIVAHFDSKCVAVSLDPAPSTPGWGWSIADTSDQAAEASLRNCRAIAGPGRADYCVVSAHQCDGAAN